MTQYRLLSHRKWLSIRYWGMLRNALLWGPWSLKFRHLLNRWPWPNIVGCHYCCGPTKPPILDLFAITQYSILSHNKLLSIEYWVLKDTESLYFTISTLCNGFSHVPLIQMHTSYLSLLLHNRNFEVRKFYTWKCVNSRQIYLATKLRKLTSGSLNSRVFIYLWKLYTVCKIIIFV